MDRSQLEEIIASIFAEQYKVLAKSIEDMISRGISAKPFPPYKGIWDADELFEANDMVTQSGALWHASAASKGIRPGSDDGAKVWKLAVKKVKAAKLPTMALSDEGELSMICEGAEPVVIGSIKGLVVELLKKHGAIKEETT